MLVYIKKWWDLVEENIHHHHDNEEKYLFPYMNKKIKLPDSMTDQHKDLLILMSNVTQTIAKLSNTQDENDILNIIKESIISIEKLDLLLVPHLKEEEDDGIPLLFNNFEVKDFEDQVLSKIVNNLPDHSLGHFFRLYPSLEKKKQVAVVVLGMPSLVAKMIVPKKVEEYEYNYGYLI